MATKAEVRDRAATELGRLRLGQSLQDQDKTRIESAYDEVYAKLKDRGLSIWASTAAVPTACVPYMAMLVAHSCMNTYSVPPARFERIAAMVGLDGEKGISEIASLVRPYHESLEEPTDY